MLPRPTPPDFSKLRVAVVGDIIADHYLYARPRRLSREAPVMVLSHDTEDVTAGGGANVARNLKALGAEVCVLGVVGEGAHGTRVVEQLAEEGIDVSGILQLADWQTPTKTRILAAEPRRSLQQVLRIDREPQSEPSLDAQERVAQRLLDQREEIDAILVADYEYGLVGDPVGRAVSELAAQGKVVVLDPRRILDSLSGVTALTPNMNELARFCGMAPEDLEQPGLIAAAASALIARLDCAFLLVTRGNLGMQLFGEGLPAAGVLVSASGTGEVTDVCGAGDTAAAVFALALASGYGPETAMVMANAASGVVVLEHGAAVCSVEELTEALGSAPQPVPAPPLPPGTRELREVVLAPAPGGDKIKDGVLPRLRSSGGPRLVGP